MSEQDLFKSASQPRTRCKLVVVADLLHVAKLRWPALA